MSNTGNIRTTVWKDVGRREEDIRNTDISKAECLRSFARFLRGEMSVATGDMQGDTFAEDVRAKIGA